MNDDDYLITDTSNDIYQSFTFNDNSPKTIYFDEKENRDRRGININKIFFGPTYALNSIEHIKEQFEIMVKDNVDELTNFYYKNSKYLKLTKQNSIRVNLCQCKNCYHTLIECYTSYSNIRLFLKNHDKKNNIGTNMTHYCQSDKQYSDYKVMSKFTTLSQTVLPYNYVYQIYVKYGILSDEEIP